MIACGGGKNGSGSQANFAVATSHSVSSRPSANSHGARGCKPAPKRPSQLPPSVATTMPPAMANAATASPWVRGQSPRSCHHRQDSPNTTHARPAKMPALLASKDFGSDVGNDSGRPANAAPSSADCGRAMALDAEYVDID